MSEPINIISRKKPFFPVIPKLQKYLNYYGRATDLPVSYGQLKFPKETIAVIDNNGNDTLWETYLYNEATFKELNHSLTKIYALLKTQGDISVMEHLYISRIDYCSFGNSNPFRIRVVNQLNDNYDYFYVKIADASRIYGLELEHILSPNRINYLVDGNTLIEEHIPGIPGDQFISDFMDRPSFNKVRIAKEFVKFNERCFVRLLGDMRSYNYVIDITPDFEEEQYRIRAIDFDQQSYEGKRTLYMPQFFKENNAIVTLAIELMNKTTLRQYQYEERTLMVRRIRAAKHMLLDLVNCMRQDNITSREKLHQLRKELAEYHSSPKFKKCTTMGDLVRQNLHHLLQHTRPG